jgi:hypothetical protein
MAYSSGTLVQLTQCSPFNLAHSKRIVWFFVGLARTIHLEVYTVYIRFFWQGNYHTYGHIRCVYTVLANPTYECAQVRAQRLWLVERG